MQLGMMTSLQQLSCYHTLPRRGTNANENSSNKDYEARGYSIYKKGLPLNVTPSLLENEFKKFGPFKNGGIQVRSQKGFCFGFVEFEVASAVQSAIKEYICFILG
nr:hypothetical protein CFP56_35579 [Quercus suber]